MFIAPASKVSPLTLVILSISTAPPSAAIVPAPEATVFELEPFKTDIPAHELLVALYSSRITMPLHTEAAVFEPVNKKPLTLLPFQLL